MLRNPTEACRRLAQDLQKRAPSITHHNVHWLFGMDISGSMRGGRLDSAKEMLRQWVTYVVVPGDRITLAAFDDEVRLFGPWEVGSDKAPLLTSLLDPLSVRFRPGGGSALQDVREKLLSVAAADTDKERAPITLLITDRDDPDAMPRQDNFSRRLVERYGGQFTANAEQKNEDAIEGQVPVSILKPSGQGITYLVVIVSVATRASALPAKSGMEPRRIPLAEPVTMRHEGHDPAAGLRAFLALVPWIVLAVTAVLAAWLWTAGRAGRLVGDTQHGNLILPWRPFRQPPRNIPASRDASGLRLEPERAGFEGIVLQAAVENPWAWKRWEARLSAITPFQVRKDVEDWQEQTLLLPDREYRLVVKDRAGQVGSGRMQFRPDGRTQNLYRAAMVCAVLFLVLLVAGPFLRSALPEPDPATEETITSEVM